MRSRYSGVVARAGVERPAAHGMKRACLAKKRGVRVRLETTARWRVRPVLRGRFGRVSRTIWLQRVRHPRFAERAVVRLLRFWSLAQPGVVVGLSHESGCA